MYEDSIEFITDVERILNRKDNRIAELEARIAYLCRDQDNYDTYLVRRIGELEAENKRLREACDARRDALKLARAAADERFKIIKRLREALEQIASCEGHTVSCCQATARKALEGSDEHW